MVPLSRIATSIPVALAAAKISVMEVVTSGALATPKTVAGRVETAWERAAENQGERAAITEDCVGAELGDALGLVRDDRRRRR